MSYWSEIRNDHWSEPDDLEGDLLAAVSIDAWRTGDDNEEGAVIAKVLLSRSGDVLVDYHDGIARRDEYAQEMIADAQFALKDHFKEINSRPEVFCEIKWSREDVKVVFEKLGIPATEENIDIACNKSKRCLQERSIEEGWEILEILIDDIQYHGHFKKMATEADLGPKLSSCEDKDLLLRAFSSESLKKLEETIRLWDDTDVIKVDEMDGLYREDGEPVWQSAIAWWEGSEHTLMFCQMDGDYEIDVAGIEGLSVEALGALTPKDYDAPNRTGAMKGKRDSVDYESFQVGDSDAER